MKQGLLKSVERLQQLVGGLRLRRCGACKVHAHDRRLMAQAKFQPVQSRQEAEIVIRIHIYAIPQAKFCYVVFQRAVPLPRGSCRRRTAVSTIATRENLASAAPWRKGACRARSCAACSHARSESSCTCLAPAPAAVAAGLTAAARRIERDAWPCLHRRAGSGRMEPARVTHRWVSTRIRNSQTYDRTRRQTPKEQKIASSQQS